MNTPLQGSASAALPPRALALWLAVAVLLTGCALPLPDSTLLRLNPVRRALVHHSLTVPSGCTQHGIAYCELHDRVEPVTQCAGGASDRRHIGS